MSVDKNIIEQVAEYLKNLLDGSNLTMYQAMNIVHPGISEQIDLLDFGYVYEVTDLVEKSGDILLDFTEHDDKVEGLPCNLDFYVRKKQLKNVRIESNLLGYGPCPLQNTPAMQKLTISSNGRYWFTEYLFGDGDYPYKKVGRKLQGSIGKERAYKILSAVKGYYESDSESILATDIGDWKMYAKDLDDTELEAYGSLCGGIYFDDESLEETIKKSIPIDDMALFGDGDDDEYVDE